jgi:hypothetical protein
VSTEAPLVQADGGATWGRRRADSEAQGVSLLRSNSSLTWSTSGTQSKARQPEGRPFGGEGSRGCSPGP